MITATRYAIGALLVLTGASFMAQGMQKTVEAPRSPLLRSQSEPSLHAFFIRSGSHDNIIIDLHHSPSSPSPSSLSSLNYTNAEALSIPLLTARKKQTSLCKRLTPTSKVATFLASAAIIIAAFWAADQMFDASNQLRDGAAQVREQLDGAKDDVSLVRDTFTMCKQLMRMCLPCIPKEE